MHTIGNARGRVITQTVIFSRNIRPIENITKSVEIVQDTADATTNPLQSIFIFALIII